MSKYKIVLFFFFMLIAMQLAHVALLGALKYFDFLSYDQESTVLSYGFQIILFLGIIYLLKRFNIDLKLDLKFPAYSLYFFSFFLLIFTFLLQNLLSDSFISNLLNEKLLFLQLNSISKSSILSNFNPFIISILLAPILEEILYRRIIFKKILEEHNLPLSIFITSILFTLMHGDLGGFVSYFFVGLVLTYLYHLTRNLLLNIIFHSTFNVLTYFTIFETYDITNSFFFVCIVIYLLCLIGMLLLYKKRLILFKNP